MDPGRSKSALKNAKRRSKKKGEADEAADGLQKMGL
jgi:hypothetical protein